MLAPVRPQHWHHVWWRELRDGVVSTAVTVRSMMLAPRSVGHQFAEASANGTPVVNPLTVFGTTAGFLSPLILMLKHVMGRGQTNAAQLLLRLVEPYVQFVALGLLCHFFLKRMRVATQPWHTTLGLAFYASALAVVADLFGFAVGAAVTSQAVEEPLQYVAALIGLPVGALYLHSFALALAGAHRSRWWRVALCVAMAGVSLIAVRVGIAATPAFADDGLFTFDAVKRPEEWKQRIAKGSAEFGTCSAFAVSPDGLIATDAACATRCLRNAQVAEAEKPSLLGRACKVPGLPAAIPLLDLLYCAPQQARISGDRYTQGFLATSREQEVSCLEPMLRLVHGVEIKTPTSAPCNDGCEEYDVGGRTEITRYERISDARLVFLPERGAAWFGGPGGRFDAPHVTFSAALVRAYKDGRPAQLAHYLRLSPDRPSEGDTAFLAGSPSSTTRYLSTQQATERQEHARRNVSWALEWRAAASAAAAYNPAPWVRRWLESNEEHVTQMSVRLGAFNSRLFDEAKARDAALAMFFAAEPKTLARLQKMSNATQHDDGSVASEWLLWSNEVLLARVFNVVARVEEEARPKEDRLKGFAEEAGYSNSRAYTIPIDLTDEVILLAQLLRNTSDQAGNSAMYRQLSANKDPLTRAQELMRGTRMREQGALNALYAGGQRAIDGSNDPVVTLARQVVPGLLRALRLAQKTGAEERALTEEYYRLSRAAGLTPYPDAIGTPRLRVGKVLGIREGSTEPALNPLGLMFGLDGQNRAYQLPQLWRDRKTLMDLAMPVTALANVDGVFSMTGHQSDFGAAVVNADGRVIGIAAGGSSGTRHAELRYDAAQSRTVFVTSEALLHVLENVYGAQALVAELIGSAVVQR